MNIETIIEKHNRLDRELQLALATMERKDRIQEIRLEMLENQKNCPHVDNNYNWAMIDGCCPYCGKKIGVE